MSIADMDPTKLPPLDPAVNRPDAGSAPTLTSRPSLVPSSNAPTEPASSTAITVLVDQVDIHPLDLYGALQIMIAEVRAALPPTGAAPAPGLLTINAPHGGGAGRLEPLLLAGGGLPAEPLVATVPQTLVQLFLLALPAPETLEPAAWLMSVMEVEGAVQLALDRAVEATSAWRDVPSVVVDGARETRAVVAAAITDDPPNPLWLRPEWLGLAPRMERYWRRRKRARRWLSDPDLHWRERDAELESRDSTEER